MRGETIVLGRTNPLVQDPLECERGEEGNADEARCVSGKRREGWHIRRTRIEGVYREVYRDEMSKWFAKASEDG